MRVLKSVWEREGLTADTTMLWAAACLCFFGFLRSGEAVSPTESTFDPLVHLTVADVGIDSRVAPKRMEVRIKASKTDPFRKGVTLYLGRTYTDLCPVAAMLGYLGSRGCCPGPLFIFGDGKFLTRSSFTAAVRRALEAGGLPASSYAGHSFRIGAATTAAMAGLPESLIKTLGRWESSAYTVYIRTPPERLMTASRVLGAEAQRGSLTQHNESS